MTTGARSTEQWREHRALLEAIQRGAPLPEPAVPPPAPESEPEPTPASPVERIGVIVLALMALLWLAAVITSGQNGAAPVAEIAARISLASGPLALLGIAYLLIQRTSRREAERFGRTAAAMRSEAESLDATIARLGARIDDNRRAVTEHAQALLSLGEDSALRLAELSTTMQRETGALTRQSEQLESAAATAFSDMGVLIGDLPRIEAQVHTLATLLRDTGREASEQVVTLSTELVTLAERARDADDVAGGAAQRLSAHLARIESISDAAGNRIDAAATGIARTVDTALSSASEAVDATRASIDTQGAALLAMIERSKVAIADAGSNAAGSLEGRLAASVTQVEGLGVTLARHDESAAALLAGLSERIAAVDRALADADENGTTRAARLSATLGALSEEALGVGRSIEQGNVSADELIARSQRLQGIVTDYAIDLGENLPALLAGIEADAKRGSDVIDSLLPRADSLATGFAGTGQSLARIDALLAGQQAKLDGIGNAAGEQLTVLEERARAVEAVLLQTGERAQSLVGGAGPQLLDALLRVRDTAAQAADHAGRAFGEVIQNAAAALGAETRKALDAQLGDAVEERLAAIAAASDRAVAAAEEASNRLTGEIAAITSATQTIEQRIAEARSTEDAGVEDAVSSRVAHLIEQLNSSAVDVAKLLSSDIPDTLWAAYLKGDRGIFTRRAARLIDEAGSQEIARRYEDEPAFRDEVNRYIHDFEGMLRHILATRDGSLLGVTLLSADMGKLYVALAQAIERLQP